MVPVRIDKSVFVAMPKLTGLCNQEKTWNVAWTHSFSKQFSQTDERDLKAGTEAICQRSAQMD